MTILIVEDNPGVRRMLRRAVAGVAALVWECEDGDQALAAYHAHQPRVVLMDVRMARVDGLAATRQIRHADAGARVVIVTDYDDDAVRSAAAEAGASGYVLKQNLTELADIVSTFA